MFQRLLERLRNKSLDSRDAVARVTHVAPVLRIIKDDLIEPVGGEPSFPQVIRIAEADLEDLDFDFLTITLEDLAKVAQQIIRIDPKDIPEIIRIRKADLPPDLNYMTTECYHGTSRAAAEKIRREGFRVGPGMAMGAGIYYSVGGMSIARGYLRTSNPCIIRSRISWGKVAYLDNPKIPKALKRGSGEARTNAGLKLGYKSFLTSSKYSKSSPAIGIVLGKRGAYVRPPRIEVMELIDPRSKGRR